MHSCAWYLLPCLLAIALAGPEAVRAQDEPIEMIRKYGPDPEVIPSETIQLGLRMLQWQQQLHDAQIAKITVLRERWQQEQAAAEREIEAIQRHLQQVGLFLADRRTLDELAARDMDLQIQLTGMQSHIDTLQHAIQAAQQNDSDAADTEELLLQKQVDNRAKAMDHIKQLHEKGAVSDSEVATYEQSLLEAQVRLEQYQRVESEQASVLQTELVHRSMELHSLTRQRDMVRQQIEQIAASVARAEKLQARNHFASTRIQECDTQIAGLQLENTRAEALMQLINKSLSGK